MSSQNSKRQGFSRRKFVGFGLGAATAALAPLPLTQSAFALGPVNRGPVKLSSQVADPASYQNSVNNAFLFQHTMMDAYVTGSTVRLTQSYSDAALGATAFTYDNAVAIHAYLVRDHGEDLPRARVLGDGLVYAQATNFPFNDGRFAQAYFVNTPATDGSGAYITPAAYPFYFYSSAVGDQAWAGMALAQLYRATGEAKYLTAAIKTANWIVTNTYNTLGAGGYSFGTYINQYNESLPSPNGKSTEHNIDTYAFFTMLAKLTKNGKAGNGSTWTALAQHAFLFIQAMYNATDGYFFTGTDSDQITINYYPVPEDVQTWSYLALLDNKYKQTIDWAVKNLETTDTANAKDTSLTGTEKYTGMVFDTASLNTTAYDPNAVWLEGTAHTVAALTQRVIYGQETFGKDFNDLETALKFIKNSQNAQAQLGAGQTAGGKLIPLGLGLVASTSLMDTGFGYTYGPSLHIGATGWYQIAALGGNPFQLGYGSLGGLA